MYNTSTSKSLKYFMREQKDETVEVPAPKGFVDDEGKPIMMEVKVLTNKRVQEIFAAYRKRKIATNEKGVPYIGPGGEVVFQTDRDTPRAIRHIIAEALVFPNLKDKEIMEHYNCADISEMTQHVFPRSDEYAHVSRMVLNALGLGDEGPSDDDLIDDAKNS